MNSGREILQIIWADVWMRLSLGVLVVMILGAIFIPVFSSWDPSTMTEHQFASPSGKHWLGTDFHGRDLMVRVASGLGLSLAVGCVGALVSLGIGVTYGLISGYVGGRVDAVMMRLVEVLYSVPRLVMVIVLMAALEKPMNQWLSGFGWGSQARVILLFAGLGCVEWLTMARIVRGQVRVMRELPYIQAAEAMGQTRIKILLTHLLPNLVGIVMVYATLTIPAIILEESFLSYLGLGIEPPAASLGTLISEAADQLNPLQIHLAPLLAPAGVMVVLMFSLNILGDGLRDALDPKLRQR